MHATRASLLIALLVTLSTFVVAAPLMLFTWPPMFRLMRAHVLGVRDGDT